MKNLMTFFFIIGSALIAYGAFCFNTALGFVVTGLIFIALAYGAHIAANE